MTDVFIVFSIIRKPSTNQTKTVQSKTLLSLSDEACFHLILSTSNWDSSSFLISSLCCEVPTNVAVAILTDHCRACKNPAVLDQTGLNVPCPPASRFEGVCPQQTKPFPGSDLIPFYLMFPSYKKVCTLSPRDKVHQSCAMTSCTRR